MRSHVENNNLPVDKAEKCLEGPHNKRQVLPGDLFRFPTSLSHSRRCRAGMHIMPRSRWLRPVINGQREYMNVVRTYGEKGAPHPENLPPRTVRVQAFLRI